MTYDRRDDPGQHDHEHGSADETRADETPADETRVVERETYVERERPVVAGYVPPPQPAGGQVNVSSGRATVVERGHNALYYARRVVTLLFSILAVLIAIRVVLLALGANQANQIVDFVMDLTEPFVGPFRGMFQFEVVTAEGRSVFDIAAVVAFVGWLLIYLLLMAILSLADRDRTT